jgi:NAD-dependent SIR2 family protein deacetylase
VIRTEEEKLVQIIAEELQKKDTILYIGSGVSCWSGLPSWGKLLSDLSLYVSENGYSNEHINKAISNGKYLYAASLSKKQLTAQEYAYFLKKEMGDESIQPSKLHEAIVQLGCNNYVTTNYDKLLEKTLHLRGREIQVISNKNLVELPIINRLDACNYILKSHGDIDDVDSIILTREDYSKLYQDTSNIAQTLKTLFLTRTVIFVGFGLSDPDFDHIRDCITNTYGCQQIVHYAIMPDMEADEKRYWKEQYGIKVLSYHTSTDNSQHKHDELLLLIQRMGEIIETRKALHDSTEKNISETAFQLSLIKYLSRLNCEFSCENTFPVGVREGKNHDKNHRYLNIEQEIDCLYEKTTKLNKIIAKPGMGKTFALKQYCRKLAQIALEELTINDGRKSDYKVPLYIDMKYYEGSIKELVNRVFPESFGGSILFQKHELVIILDSINEIATKYLGEHQFEKELLQYISSNNRHTFYLVSRTGEEIEFIDSKIYEITGVSASYFAQQEKNGNLPLLNYEEKCLLRSPLFLSFYEKDRTISLKANNFYEIYFKKLREAYMQEYHKTVNFVSLLQQTAYDMIFEGTEIIQYESVVELFHKHGIDDECVNWLLDKNRLFIAGINHQLQFFHQSITEFLAANQLTVCINENPSFIDSILKSTRWDYVIQLVSSYLEDNVIDCIFLRLLEVDCILAMKASAHLEKRQEFVAEYIVDYLLLYGKNTEDDMGLYNAIINVPFSKKHIEKLLMLVEQRRMYSSAVISVIEKLYERESVPIFVSLYVKYVNDYNLANELARMLVKYPLDIEEVLDKLKQVKLINSDAVSSSMGILLKKFSWENINMWIEKMNLCDEMKNHILDGILREKNGAENIELCIALIKDRKSYAVFPLYLNCDKNSISCTQLSADFFDALEDIIISEKDYWGIELLDDLYRILPELEEEFEQRRYKSAGVVRLIYTYCLREKDLMSFLVELREFLLKEEEQNFILIQGFTGVDYGQEFEKIMGYVLDRKNNVLLKGFLESVRDESYALSDEMGERLLSAMGGEVSPWTNFLIGERIGMNMTTSVRKIILKQFNEKCKRKMLLTNLLYPRFFDDLQKQDFTEESIQYLLDELLCSGLSKDILAQILVDGDVNEILLPLLCRCENEQAKSNVLNVIKLIGQKCQKRYLVEGA